MCWPVIVALGAVLLGACAQAEPSPTPQPTAGELKGADGQAAEKVLTLEQRVWNERIEAALAPSPCPTVQKVEFDDFDYSGPLIDTHFHMAQLWDAPPREEGGDGYEFGVMPVLGKNIAMSEIACVLEQEGTAKVFAFFPVVADRSGQLRALLEVVKRTMEQHPTRFVPFIMTPVMGEVSPTLDATILSEFLAVDPSLFRGYGEIVFYDFEGRRGHVPSSGVRVRHRVAVV